MFLHLIMMRDKMCWNLYFQKLGFCPQEEDDEGIIVFSLSWPHNLQKFYFDGRKWSLVIHKKKKILLNVFWKIITLKSKNYLTKNFNFFKLLCCFAAEDVPKLLLLFCCFKNTVNNNTRVLYPSTGVPRRRKRTNALQQWTTF